MRWTGRKVSDEGRAALEALGMVEAEPWELYISGQGLELDDELHALEGLARGPVIGLLGSRDMVSKAGLWIGLARRFGRETAARITAETWLLDHGPDRGRLAKQEGPFIVKAPGVQQRRGVSLARDAAEALEHGAGVAQRLLPSMLIQGHAFHLRCYLIAHSTPTGTQLLLHRASKLVYAPAPAHEGGVDACITRSEAPVPEGAPRTMDALAETLAQPRALLAKVRKCLRAVVMTFPMRKPAAAATAAMPFGVDLLVGPQFDLRVLEVNGRPDLRGRDPEDSARKQAVWLDTLRAAGALEGATDTDVLASIP